MKQSISIQLFQFTPTAAFLQTPIISIKSDLETFLSNEKYHSVDDKFMAQIQQAEKLEDLVLQSQYIENSLYQAKWLTYVFNILFDNLMNHNHLSLNWNKHFRAFELNEQLVLIENDTNQLLQLKLGYIKFSYFKKLDNGKKLPVFILQIKNKLNFAKPLHADELATILQDKNLYLPVFDLVKNSSMVLKRLSAKPIFHYLPSQKRSRRDNNQSIRYSELFVKHGRMTQEEADKIMQSKRNFAIAEVSAYQNNYLYSYPARDLIVIASDSLLKLKNESALEHLPKKLVDMIQLYEEAKRIIVDEMENKAVLLKQTEDLLSTYFKLMPTTTGYQQIIKTPRFKVKKDEKTKLGIENDIYYYQDMLPKSAYGKLVIAYPSYENYSEKIKTNFLSFFTGTYCQVRKANLEFDIFDYSENLAGKNAKVVVEDLLSAHPNCASVLIAWTNYKTLTNNKLIEFELIKRGIAVQHVVIQGKKLDAFKVSALIKGMQEKFPVIPTAKYREQIDFSPFDICMGLDISRYAREDIASIPVAIDKFGMVRCCMSENFATESKEKRKNEEIILHIHKVLDAYQAKNVYHDKINILFLRDGIAYEDYHKIAEVLSERAYLTVVSLRKNIISITSEELIIGEFSSIDAVLEKDLFIIGANARQGDAYKITQVHLAQIVTKPEHINLEQIKKMMLTLISCNITTESQMASLPMPIAYADRLAGDIREFIQDSQLLSYVSKNYSTECNEFGGPKRFVYHIIQQYMTTRINGEAFSV